MEQQKDNQQKHFIDKQQSSNIPNRANVQQHAAVHGSQSATALGKATTNLSHQQIEREPLDGGFAYIVRKAEKLTTALYLVTDIMSEKEPMKWKTRESGVELLSDITISSSLPVSEKMTLLRNAMKKIDKIIAFLDVAHAAHLMSEMNSSLLKREYINLKDNIEREWIHVYEKSKSIFSDSFFDVPRESLLNMKNLGTPESETPERLQNIPRQSFSNQPVEHHEPQAKSGQFLSPKPLARPFQNHAVTQDVPSKPLTPITTEKKIGTIAFPQAAIPMVRPQSYQPATAIAAIPQSQEMFSSTRNDANRDDRRKIILALIKQKPALTVKDITKSIPNVSEKTIQRELLSMVSENVLVKRGERRWSTYSLREG